MKMSRSSVANYIQSLKANPKRIYIVDFERALQGGGGRETPVWAAGNKPDAEYVRLNIPSRMKTPDERRQQILDIIAVEPMTINQIAAKIYLSNETVRKYLVSMRKKGNKRAYIARWIPPYVRISPSYGGDWAAAYLAGDRRDSPKPTPETPSQRHHRKMKSAEYRQERRKKSKANYLLKQMRKKKQNIFSAIGL